ncbi:MAG: anti-sigma factor antagonist [Planctomycetota bacterium]|nr:MAG: anti-sigma factor antagonist [Planctomycetota bacterium]
MSLDEFAPAYLRLSQDGDVVVVSFTVPQLNEEENIEQLGRELFALVEQFGCRKVAVSLLGVDYITSSAIGKLITLHRKLHRNNGRLVLCDVTGEVENVLRTSKLLSYFNVAESAAEARRMLAS